MVSCTCLISIEIPQKRNLLHVKQYYIVTNQMLLDTFLEPYAWIGIELFVQASGTHFISLNIRMLYCSQQFDVAPAFGGMQCFQVKKVLLQYLILLTLPIKMSRHYYLCPSSMSHAMVREMHDTDEVSHEDKQLLLLASQSKICGTNSVSGATCHSCFE